jgi:hypothetical protein
MLIKLILPLKQRLYDFPRRAYWKEWEQVNLREHVNFISCVEKNDPEGAADVWKNQHWGWSHHKSYFVKFYGFEDNQDTGQRHGNSAGE